MNSLATPTDYRKAWSARFSPKCASQIESIIASRTPEARGHCERMFHHGNFGVTQGVLRWQLIDDACHATQFDGGVRVESRDFAKGELLDGNESRNKITMLRSDEVVALISKVGKTYPLPKPAYVKKFLASLPFPSQPLFHELFNEHMPSDIRAAFFIRYFLDEWDSDNATVADIDVVVLNWDCKSIFCHVCDLREYAAGDVETYIYNQPLPITLREGMREMPSGQEAEIRVDDHEHERPSLK